MITDPDVFFRDGCGRCARFATPDCSARLWAAGLQNLRAICLAAGLTETAKWGHPCYMHAGRNIAILGAFRGDLRLTFFNASLLNDRGSILSRQGENSPVADCARFADAAQIAAVTPALQDLLAQAKAHATAGTKPAKTGTALVLPDELITAIDADPALAEAFHALTPGRQKSHALAIASAKASATRAARVLKLTPLIMAGKGALDR